MSDSRPSDIFAPGDLLNNTYRIEAVLGRGGTSEVYRARNENSGRVVAIKALRSEFSQNDDYMYLMRREEEIREVRHDVVLRYYDIQRTEDGRVYLIMDFVDGPGLNQKMLSGGMSASDLMVVAERVAEGLEAAHAKNIVHRDLSPDNIILNNGEPSQAVIIDFGIAKDENPGAETIVGSEFAGKYAYAAPEQLAGMTDARSDIYSLGALLLATFRGKAPDAGSNPLEVVNNKKLALDTEGVPEPLKSLIDRMTVPDPSERFQSATATLQAMRGTAQPSQVAAAPVDPDEDRTIVAPKPGKPAEDRQKPAGSSGKSRSAEKPSGSGSGRGLTAVLGALAVVVAIGGGYALGLFDSLLGPGYETVDPFTFHAERRPDGRLTATGYVPSETVQQEVDALVSGQGGTAELFLATGDISEVWGDALLGVLGQVADLEEWRVLVNGNQISVTGLSEDRAQQQRLNAELTASLPDTMAMTTAIQAGPRILSAELLEPILAEHADCGALFLVGAPAMGFELDETIDVDGRVASIETRVALSDDIADVAGSRLVQVSAEVLNPTLCLVDAALPAAPSVGMRFLFGYGDRPEPNETGRYFVGENPVIDLEIPAELQDGYLYVSALDVSGNVFHLLPNRNRADNAIAELAANSDSTGRIRLAYALDDADDGRNLAFVVDPETLGKTKLIAILAQEPLFDDIRPTTESAAGFVAALETTTAPVIGIDSRILVTAEP